MAYHVRLGHMPFDRIQLAAKQGILPQRIANCHVPKCASCLFGKAKRRPWRTRGHAGQIGKSATKPGDVVSVDQLISETPGLVAQSTGKLMKRRHSVATIFADHASGLDFVYPQESTSAKDTLEAKQAFERFASRHNVVVRHYHCDNGIFASEKFRAAVDQSNQTLTFCGVNAHHQNGVAERRIQDLADRTRSMLVNARHRNPFATDNLWPFALRLASEIDRTIPKRSNTKSPLELFTGVDRKPIIFDPSAAPFMSSMPLSRPGNLNPNGRKGLALVVIWDSRRNMLRQSRSSSIHGRASSPLNFTAYLMKTSKPYRTWAALPHFGPSTRNSSPPPRRNTPPQMSLLVLTLLGSFKMIPTMMHRPPHHTALPSTRRPLRTTNILLPPTISTTNHQRPLLSTTPFLANRLPHLLTPKTREVRQTREVQLGIDIALEKTREAPLELEKTREPKPAPLEKTREPEPAPFEEKEPLQLFKAALDTQ
jgi:hypothetical protein